MLKIGSSTKLNKIIGVGNALVTTTDEMETYPLSLKRGSIVYNEATKEIKIADGETPINRLGDHKHPLTHAPLIHDHIHNANEPWLVANPKLWYVDDLANHPDLCVLDGRELPDDVAEHLSTVYTGAQLATFEITSETTRGFENNYCILTTGSYKDYYPSSNLFNDPIDNSNLHKLQDQWLVDDTDLNTTVTINITFKNNISYRPMEYQLIPANGYNDNVFVRRPTPRSWTLEGYINNSDWVVLDRHTDVEAEEWNFFVPNAFTVDTTKTCTVLRLTINQWNVGDKLNMEVGLRRFWVFGRKNNVFALPQLVSPDPNFAWVVPYRNLNVGLHHEDVGDIGTTSILPQYLPEYRLPTDGRSLQQDLYPLLYAAIGHNEDRVHKPSLYTVSCEGHTCTSYYNTEIGEVTFVTADTTNKAPTISFEFTPPDKFYMGKYKLDFTGYAAKPSEWSIEVYNTDTKVWSEIQHFINVTEEDFTSRNNIFYIDQNYSDYTINKIRLNILSWRTTGSIGGRIIFYSHKKDEFYIPTISTPDRYTYIVSDLSAVDVTPDIIQALQARIITLTQTIARLQAQVNTLDSRLNGD